MKQNLVSLEFSAAQLEAVDAALVALEKNLAELVTLTAEQRRKAAVRLIAKVPTLSSLIYRHGKGLPANTPDTSLSHTGFRIAAS